MLPLKKILPNDMKSKSTPWNESCLVVVKVAVWIIMCPWVGGWVATAVTLARSRSMAFMRLPWKYLTRVCCLFNKPSNSKSGSALQNYLWKSWKLYVGWCLSHFWEPKPSQCIRERSPKIGFNSRGTLKIIILIPETC